MTELHLDGCNLNSKPTQKTIKDYIEEQAEELKIKSINSTSDLLEIANILNKYLNYPNEQLAIIHRKANRLGYNDLKPSSVMLQNTSEKIKNDICRCCGYAIQEGKIPVCATKFEDISFGASNIVFFKTITNLAFLLVIMLIVYSGYSLATNIIAAPNSNNAPSYLLLSLGAKDPQAAGRQNQFLISSWLGVAMIALWGFMLAVMNYKNKIIEKQQRLVDSASDFSVSIERIPYGITLQQFQAQINQYFDHILDQSKDIIGRLKVQKYNQGKPFYFNESEFNDKQLKQLHSKKQNLRMQFRDWIIERQDENDFSTTQPYRNKKYKDYEINQKKIQTKYQQIRRNFRARLQQENRQTKTTSFVTFQTIQQKNFFLKHNKDSLLSSLRQFLPCCHNDNRFTIRNKEGKEFRSLIVESAPEPEDINWNNLGVKKCQKFYRKFLTFLATAVMLGISLVIVYALSRIQVSNQDNQYVSILISLAIAGINALIIKVIQFTTEFERDYTTQNYQVSLALKSIIAQLINLIFVPFVVNYWIKDQKVYGKSSLSDNIFILSITSSIIAPLARLFDPYYMYLAIVKWYKFSPKNKLLLNQYQLNGIAEKMEFQVGFEYIYLISNFLFTCYYVSLQPIIPAFAILGLFLMYWIQKYSLFRRCQRPIPGTDKISKTMYQIIYFGGIAYTLGNFTWSIFLPNSQFTSSLIANIIAGGLSLLIFLFPYQIIFERCFHEDSAFQISYENRRIYFTSEYDRLNPNTSKEAVEQYKNFIAHKKAKIDSLPIQQKQLIYGQFLHLTNNNAPKMRQFQRSGFFGNSQDAFIQNLVQNQYRNISNPRMIANTLLPDLVGNINRVNPPNTQVRVGSSIDQFYVDSGKNLNTNNLEQHIAVTDIAYRKNNPLNDNDFRNPYSSNINYEDLGISSNIKELSNKKKNSDS